MVSQGVYRVGYPSILGSWEAISPVLRAFSWSWEAISPVLRALFTVLGGYFSRSESLSTVLGGMANSETGKRRALGSPPRMPPGPSFGSETGERDKDGGEAQQ